MRFNSHRHDRYGHFTFVLLTICRHIILYGFSHFLHPRCAVYALCKGIRKKFLSSAKFWIVCAFIILISRSYCTICVHKTFKLHIFREMNEIALMDNSGTIYSLNLLVVLTFHVLLRYIWYRLTYSHYYCVIKLASALKQELLIK